MRTVAWQRGATRQERLVSRRVPTRGNTAARDADASRDGNAVGTDDGHAVDAYADAEWPRAAMRLHLRTAGAHADAERRLPWPSRVHRDDVRTDR